MTTLFLVVPDYESLPDAIASKMFTAGLYNTDVAWFYQDALRERGEPLRIIKQLKKDQPVMIFFPREMPKAISKYFDYCFGPELYPYTGDIPVNGHRGYIKVSAYIDCLKANRPVKKKLKPNYQPTTPLNSVM